MVAITNLLRQTLFKDFSTWWMKNNCGDPTDTLDNFLRGQTKNFHGQLAMLDHNKPWRIGHKALFYDQEPLLDSVTPKYIDMFMWPYNLSFDEYRKQCKHYGLASGVDWRRLRDHPEDYLGDSNTMIISEISKKVTDYCKQYKLNPLYYFAHGYIALDWYRHHYAENLLRDYENPVKDFISMNRIVIKDRSYRIYWISMLKELKLCKHGYISFNTDSENINWRQELSEKYTQLTPQMITHIKRHLKVNRISIDDKLVPGYMSAFLTNTTQDAMMKSTWHIVSETVFWDNKLHLTEKVFKPIVFKQPFMLLGAPGNLQYLKQYGFKTFNGIIDETYDHITDPYLRMQAVGKQLAWYCGLSKNKKAEIIKQCRPIVEHNFEHFYGMFKYHLTNELFDNTKKLMYKINFDQDRIKWEKVHKALIHSC